MDATLSPQFLMASGFIWILLLLLARIVLPLPAAAGVATVRVLFPLIYFGFYWDGRWNFIDDFTYYSNGLTLYDQGFNPFTVLLDPDGWDQLTTLAGGAHVLYTWWNLTGVFLLGPQYYAPVLLNVVLTFAAGILMVRMLRMCNLSQIYSRWFFAFFLLHWDVMSWSSFINLKDILVMTLTVATFAHLHSLSKRWSLLNALGTYGCLLTILFVRYYLVFLILATAGVWGLFQAKNRLQFLATLVAPLVPILFIVNLESRVDSEIVPMLHSEGFVFSLMRFTLTPQPWSIDPAYSFLLIPSILHWLLLIPALIGGVLLWRGSKEARMLLLYFVVISVFYSFVPELQGPRHRLQIVFILAWAQFHFLWTRLRLPVWLETPPGLVEEPLLAPGHP